MHISSVNSFFAYYTVFNVLILPHNFYLVVLGGLLSHPGAFRLFAFGKKLMLGGPKWTRTTDLTLIRRAL